MTRRTATPEEIERAQQAARALDLRKAGYTYAEIADDLEVSPYKAHKLVTRELEKLNRHRAETADQILRLEVERCDAVLRELWPQRGVARVAEVLMKVMERKAKFLGLDKPLQIEQVGRVEEMTDEDLAEEARRLGMTLPAEQVRYRPGDLPGMDELMRELLPSETVTNTNTADDNQRREGGT